MTPTQAEPAAQRRPRWLLPVLIATAVLVLAGAGTATALLLGGGRTVTGTVHLVDPDAVWSYSRPCVGEGGFADLRAGADVTITDSAGKVVGLGKLGTGQVSPQSADACDFPFTVSGVTGSDFYGVEVAHRGVVMYSSDEIGRPLNLEVGR